MAYVSPCGVHEFPVRRVPRCCPLCAVANARSIEIAKNRHGRKCDKSARTKKGRDKRRANGQLVRAIYGAEQVTGVWQRLSRKRRERR